MPNWKKVVTSGSDAALNSLNASSITGSLQGTASYAITSSLPLLGIVTASSDMNHITFTKGDGSSFNILLVTGSVASASYSATASYVLPLVQDVIITGSLLLTGSHISEIDYIDFTNLGASIPTDQQGRIYWDDDNGTLSLGMHGGQVVQQIGLEQYYYVKNQTGTTILNGTVTYASGTLGASSRVLAGLMVANGTIPYFYTLGITTEDIVSGDEGYVTQFGLVRGINTTGSNGETWADGDVLYVSPTVPGTLTKFEPEAPNLRLQMAIVIRAATNGSIFVRPDLGSDVGSLHDVINTTTTASYGDLFVKSGSVWTSTKQLTGSYGLTGSLTATSFNGSLFGTASQALTASYVNPLIQNVLITGSFSVSGSTTFNGPITTKTTRITSSIYTASAADYRIGVRYTDTGSVSIQLPLISSVGQIEYRFKDEEGNSTVNAITLVASGINLIDGSATAILKRNYISIGLYNDGVSNWYIE